MFHLDYGDHRPLYEQVKEKFKELILSGVLKTDEKIPSVREMASGLAINPNTIQKAYRELENEGYIYSLRAKGSFVAPRENVMRRTNEEDVMEEFERIVSKMRFLGFSAEEISAALNSVLEKSGKGEEK